MKTFEEICRDFLFVALNREPTDDELDRAIQNYDSFQELMNIIEEK